MSKSTSSRKIQIGISSCLLGAEVRFDGGHKRDAYINGTLSGYFEFVPFCPEVGADLGIPRQPIRLVGQPNGDVRVLGVRLTELDATDALEAYTQQVVPKLTELSGYLFKRGSPSCGMERVKVYSPEGMPVNKASGVYARGVMAAYPLLPCEEEGRLGDPVLRENFIERVFIYHRWQQLMASGITPGKLVAFHTEHKFIVLAHNQAAYRRLGRIVANHEKCEIDAVASQYIEELMPALCRQATRKQHMNVLQHLAGYLKAHLDADDKAELNDLFDQYRIGLLPLVVPITMLRHHFRRHPSRYVARQRYLEPHPDELMLRNMI